MKKMEIRFENGKRVAALLLCCFFAFAPAKVISTLFCGLARAEPMDIQTGSSAAFSTIQEALQKGEEIRRFAFDERVAVAAAKWNEDETVYLVECIGGE